jgi:hypothetical protein
MTVPQLRDSWDWLTKVRFEMRVISSVSFYKT